MRLSWAPHSSLPRSLWIASLPSSVSIASLSLVSSANLLRLHFIQLSISPTKLLNNTSPRTNPCGTATHHQSPLDTEHWLQLSECNHPGNSLSSKRSIHQINFSPIWQPGCHVGQCQTLCTSPSSWRQLLSFNHQCYNSIIKGYQACQAWLALGEATAVTTNHFVFTFHEP